ncbi:putative Ig domain-containing protein [Telluribacter sp.]|uniref:putative Ig domain-containing protein n=1 Tax=Telluribacter sp. TaxID=1978767 RepID=UPI002E151E5F|nr:putative Ig domain-containing protein [Telluribacter sp.]
MSFWVKGKAFSPVGEMLKCMLLLLLFFSLPLTTKAEKRSEDDEKQRYFALLLLNLAEELDYELDIIRQAKEAGMNSVVLTVYWDKVYRRSPNDPGDWSKTDNQIKLATQLGMKVGIRIFVGRNTSYLPNFWTVDNSAKDFKKFPLREIYNYTHFSFHHQPSVQMAENFVREVTNRYKYLQEQKQLIYVSVVNTPTQELGYHHTNIPVGGEYQNMYASLFDYSEASVKGFGEWAQNKYKKIVRLNLLWGTEFKAFKDVYAPVNPWEPQDSFFGRWGKDWYIYRHEVLKTYNDRMIRVIKSVDPGIKYINEFGSVMDRESGLRGTLGFHDLAEHADGTKIHDLETYDHLYTMDIIRSNTPAGKWVMNEVFYDSYKPYFEYYEQIDECFQNGAKLIAFVMSTPAHIQAMREVIINSSRKWVNVPLEPIVPKDTTSYLLSRALDKGVYDVAYPNWKKLARNGGAPKPVYVKLVEDLFTEEYWKAAANNPPYLLNPLPMRIAAVGRDFSFKIPTTTFADADGQVVKVEVPNLPAWLRFENGEIKGRSDVLGDTRILVKGIDDEGGAGEAFFTIRIDTRENANQPPTVRENFPKLVIKVNESFSFKLPKEAFVDTDGSITSIEASGMPAWLTFQNGEFKGFPTTTGEYRIFVKAYDDLKAFVETFFVIQVVEPQFINNPPYLSRTLPVKYAKVNEPFAYRLPPDLFSDGDGYISLITVQNLPTWLSFSLNEFSGTPTEEADYRLIIRAYDNGGSYIDTPFLLKVEVPYLTFDLLQSGRPIDRKKLQSLKKEEVLLVDSLPALLNIYAYGNFEFDRVNFQLTGPYRYESKATKFPYALFQENGGFAPYVGRYTLTATAFHQDSLVLTTTLPFSIAAGDSLNIARSLTDWQAYPNPFERVFNIKLPEGTAASQYSFTLVTVSGQRIPVSSQKVTVYDGIAQLDLSDFTLSPGVYFIRLEENGELVKLFRVVKR